VAQVNGVIKFKIKNETWIKKVSQVVAASEGCSFQSSKNQP
jgi:hypothetical protein